MNEANFNLSDSDSIDVDDMLREVAPEQPCGANLEYDPLFLELERALQGKPEVEYGHVIAMATQPDWNLVRLLALRLLSRTRDLRASMALARALINIRGFAGFSLGLSLIERLLYSRWDSIHPQLDPSDGNDPMLRVNILSTLVDPSSVLREVKEAPIVVSRTHGNFSLRDVDIITGEILVPDDKEKPSLPILDAAFSDAGEIEIEATYQALDMAWNSTVRIEAILTDRVGATQSLDLSPLAKLLKRTMDFVQQRLAKKTDVAELGKASIDRMPANEATTVAGAIASREDVVKMLEKICTYFSENEPSSPIPLLLQRAQRLVDKNFIEILQDVSPDSLNQVYQICGIQNE